MKRQFGQVNLIALSAVLALGLVAGTAGAQDYAWDMVYSSSQGLLDYTNDAPVFSSPGDGFQKYTVGVSASIPYALVDDSVVVYPDDTLGIIDSSSDFDEFFGATDTENNDNAGPVNATWVFDISGATGDLEFVIDLAAMGNFEDTDIYAWTYQVDGGPVTPMLGTVVGEGTTITYTLADGDQFEYGDPLIVDGVTLYNYFQTFSTPISTGSQLTVSLSCVADGTYEAYAVRNMVVRGYTPVIAGNPVPTLSQTGIAVMVLLLMAGGVILIRRLH